MTQATKTVKRETLTQVRAKGFRPLIIEIHPTWVVIRVKGLGNGYRYTVTMDQIYNLGASNAAAALRAEREKARKAKRLERSKR